MAETDVAADTIVEFTGLVATCGYCGARTVLEAATDDARSNAQCTLDLHRYMQHGAPRPAWLSR